MAKRGVLALTVSATLLAGPLTSGSVGARPRHRADDQIVANPKDGTKIAITVFKPHGAGPRERVPVILHSHGWGGSRETEITGAIRDFLDAGFGVVSIDQRGHGDSEGQAHVQDPTKETEDIQAVIDRIASFNWVQHNRRNGRTIPNDPVLGAIGGSYGGGYQTMTALDEIAEDGRTRFDALAPEITWYDLPESLAPEGVPRTAWTALLYAVGARMLPQYVHEANAWGAATGQWPDGTLYGERVQGVPDLDSVFHKHSPVWFAERGIKLDIPVLQRQGTSDNLFNLNQGLKIFHHAVTDKARKSSYFVAYNGGHALPNAVPPGYPAAVELGSGADACVKDFTQLSISFFRRVFAGRSTRGLLPTRYNLTTATGKCLNLRDLGSGRPRPVGVAGSDDAVSTAGAGAPIHLEVVKGPLTLAGVPRLTGKLTAAGLDARSFFGLAVGSTPLDARVVQNNLMPLRSARPAQDKKFAIELPGVAVRVPKGQSLYLTISPNSDMYFAHGSRTPGGLVLSKLRLQLPLVGR